MPQTKSDKRRRSASDPERSRNDPMGTCNSKEEISPTQEKTVLLVVGIMTENKLRTDCGPSGHSEGPYSA